MKNMKHLLTRLRSRFFPRTVYPLPPDKDGYGWFAKPVELKKGESIHITLGRGKGITFTAHEDCELTSVRILPPAKP